MTAGGEENVAVAPDDLAISQIIVLYDVARSTSLSCAITLLKALSKLKASVMQEISCASAIRSAYHCEDSLLSFSSRALKTGVTLFGAGRAGGSGVSSRFLASTWSA